MIDKTLLIRLKPPGLSLQLVIATRVEIQAEHLAFVNSKGKLAALFLLEAVEGWFEVQS